MYHENDEKIRQKLHQVKHWGEAAAGYDEVVLSGSFIPGVHAAFVEVLAPLLNDRGGGAGLDNDGAVVVRVLDVAAASGEPSLSLAAALPGARFVATDIAEGFVALGEARAAAAGVGDRVSFAVADGERLDGFADGGFDAVTCSLGLMFFPEEVRGLAQFFRVLAPGGLLAVSVWGGGVPMFRLASEVAAGLLRSAGLPPAASSTLGTASRFGDGRALVAAAAGVGFELADWRLLDVTFGLGGGGRDWFEELLKTPFPLRSAVAAAAGAGLEGALGVARSALSAAYGGAGFLLPGGLLRAPGNECHFMLFRKPGGGGGSGSGGPPVSEPVVAGSLLAARAAAGAAAAVASYSDPIIAPHAFLPAVVSDPLRFFDEDDASDYVDDERDGSVAGRALSGSLPAAAGQSAGKSGGKRVGLQEDFLAVVTAADVLAAASGSGPEYDESTRIVFVDYVYQVRCPQSGGPAPSAPANSAASHAAAPPRDVAAGPGAALPLARRLLLLTEDDGGRSRLHLVELVLDAAAPRAAPAASAGTGAGAGPRAPGVVRALRLRLSLELGSLSGLVRSPFGDDFLWLQHPPASPRPVSAERSHWMPDATASGCARCHAPFSLVRRRHHCRSCGGLVCAACSSHSSPVPARGHYASVRLCDGCVGAVATDVEEDVVLLLAGRDRLSELLAELQRLRPELHPATMDRWAPRRAGVSALAVAPDREMQFIRDESNSKSVSSRLDEGVLYSIYVPPGLSHSELSES